MRYPLLALLMCWVPLASASAASLTGQIVDASTENAIAARVYVHDATGEYFHVQSKGGMAVPYDVRRGGSFEIHTSISADPFQADLPAGTYTLVVERGKEYFSETREIALVDNEPVSITIALRRWSDISAQGWYSGETHVHREVSDLSTLQLTEDLNVAFPLTAWVTDSEHTPAVKNKNQRDVPPAELAKIDATHVYWPVNTEYEIFTVKGQRHALGAVFILNHKEQLTVPAPPVGPIVAQARRQGAFLDLDKHNWPWSMMLMPTMKVDLFELSNNHIWRTGFLFSSWYPEYAARYMQVEMVDGKFTERGWIEFGFQTYYALLNCGFDMQPTAGTAAGVHPVPLGFGRVYVKLDGAFSYQKWVKGLLAGNSFVTTGPMLVTTVKTADHKTVQVTGYLESATEPQVIEVIVNGNVASTIDAPAARTAAGAFRVAFDTSLELQGASWVAVRAFTKRPEGRTRFAHTAPVHIENSARPLLPTRNQRDYLAQRVNDEISRNRGVISDEAMREYENAFRAFESLPVSE